MWKLGVLQKEPFLMQWVVEVSSNKGNRIYAMEMGANMLATIPQTQVSSHYKLGKANGSTAMFVANPQACNSSSSCYKKGGRSAQK